MGAVTGMSNKAPLNWCRTKDGFSLVEEVFHIDERWSSVSKIDAITQSYRGIRIRLALHCKAATVNQQLV